jgi:F0F1-type ATP synthase membrane subunit b/b'
MKRFALMLAPFVLALGLAGAAYAAENEGAQSGDEAGAKAEHEDETKVDAINWFNLGYRDLDVEGAKLQTGKERMPPPFGLALMNFAVFAGILVWKAGPPLRRFVEQRHISIKDALAEGRRLRKEAEEKLAEYDSRIAGVQSEVDELLAEVRESAAREKERILADAERQAAAMKKTAESQIAAEIERARAELEREVMAAAVAAAETLIRDKATPADHKKLVDGFLDDLQKTPSSAQPLG